MLNAKKRILLAEDDPNLGLLLAEYLTAKGYDMILAKDGNEALDFFLHKSPFDMCILDVMMPKKDGFSLAKEIRVKDGRMPIIFLTAKSMKEDTLLGFKSGADDYITKPFSMEELLMRMAAIFRRVNNDPLPDERIHYQLGRYTFESSNQRLLLGDHAQKLTTKESELLKLFCENLNRPVSRSLALKLIWGDDSYFNARSMDVYITKLRKLLRAEVQLKILNLHGEGFKLIIN